MIYLDTYVLQKDLRIRMLNNILENLNLEKGKSEFKVYYDKLNDQLILKVHEHEN
ncbi:sucrose-6-phosphate hydrolase [Mycoplasma tullyi]|uniref:Sucrose-6-phosphate hydrolase n=1 Tax=Mycoplasma tullyi TaxID=1612150 RepID=A0A7D7U5T0_9MOLU|nr:sucrose-6-phosphate hydrolase [Mycoplasma tullyi]